MTKRIFRSIFLVALAVLLACTVLIMSILYEAFTTSSTADQDTDRPGGTGCRR